MSTPVVQIARARTLDELMAAPAPLWYPVEGGLPVYTCGGCGELLHLNATKTIAPDGTVSPSILHSPDREGCGWHVWGRLLDWEVPGDY